MNLFLIVFYEVENGCWQMASPESFQGFSTGGAEGDPQICGRNESNWRAIRRVKREEKSRIGKFGG